MKLPEPKNAENPVSFIQSLGKNQRSSKTLPSSSVSISQNPNMDRIKATLMTCI
jgi:hypothetical protein